MIPPGSSIPHALRTYELELRGRFREALKDDATRPGAEQEIARLVAEKESELTARAERLSNLSALW